MEENLPDRKHKRCLFFKEMTGLGKLNFGDLLMDTDYKDVWYDNVSYG